MSLTGMRSRLGRVHSSGLPTQHASSSNPSGRQCSVSRQVGGVLPRRHGMIALRPGPCREGSHGRSTLSRLATGFATAAHSWLDTDGTLTLVKQPATRPVPGRAKSGLPFVRTRRGSGHTPVVSRMTSRCASVGIPRLRSSDIAPNLRADLIQPNYPRLERERIFIVGVALCEWRSISPHALQAVEVDIGHFGALAVGYAKDRRMRSRDSIDMLVDEDLVICTVN